jgi:hypothetical protein
MSSSAASKLEVASSLLLKLVSFFIMIQIKGEEIRASIFIRTVPMRLY